MHAFMITGVKIDVYQLDVYQLDVYQLDVYQHTFMHAYMDTHMNAWERGERCKQEKC